MAKATTDKDDSLKRLGGGRWQTRDERFSIEPQSGTWVVVDAEQTDDLGLPLIRGPFASLAAAKEAIATARDAVPAESPLAARLAQVRDRPAAAPPKDVVPRAGRASAAKPGPAQAETPVEPRWIRDLEPARMRDAHRLIERLTALGAPDPEGMTRWEIVGNVPAVAAFAVGRALAALGPDAAPGDVVRLIADGSDADLGVRWRIVDGDDRPIDVGLGATKPR
jgi:hypothetical protein